MVWTRRAAVVSRKGLTGGTSGAAVSLGGVEEKRGALRDEGAGVGYLREEGVEGEEWKSAPCLDWSLWKRL